MEQRQQLDTGQLGKLPSFQPTRRKPACVLRSGNFSCSETPVLVEPHARFGPV